MFAAGVIAVVLFVFGLATGHSVQRGHPEQSPSAVPQPHTFKA